MHTDSTNEHTTTRDGVTTLVGDVVFTFYSHTAMVLDIDAHRWTFTLTDHDGWQICAISIPTLCGPILTCTHPKPTPSPAGEPSPTVTGDPGLTGVYPSGLVPMLRCGPADPFRQWHSCPASPPG